MVIGISSIVLIIGMILILTDNPEFGIIVIILSLLIGFFLCGITITVKTKTVTVPAAIYCSAEAGECRVITEIGEFTVEDYSRVSDYIENPRDSVQVLIEYNSYQMGTKTLIK